MTHLSHDIMEFNTPANKVPSVILYKDNKPPTPISKVGNSGTTVIKGPTLVNKIIIIVDRLHALADICDHLMEHAKVDETQDVVHMEPFSLVALVKGLYDEDTRN